MKWNVQQMAALSLLGEEAQGAILVFLLSVCVFNRMCSPYLDLSCYQELLLTLNLRARIDLKRSSDHLTCNGRRNEKIRTQSLFTARPELSH